MTSGRGRSSTVIDSSRCYLANRPAARRSTHPPIAAGSFPPARQLNRRRRRRRGFAGTPVLGLVRTDRRTCRPLFICVILFSITRLLHSCSPRRPTKLFSILHASPDCQVLPKLHCSRYPRDAMLAQLLGMALCLSLTSRCSIKRDERISLFLACRPLSTSPTLCFKETRVCTKMRVLPSGTFRKFRTLKISPQHINLARERWTLRE